MADSSLRPPTLTMVPGAATLTEEEDTGADTGASPGAAPTSTVVPGASTETICARCRPWKSTVPAGSSTNSQGQPRFDASHQLVVGIRTKAELLLSII